MPTISRYDSEPIELTIGTRHLTLLRVKDLERWVDRNALLCDEAEEPPYWAHLWTGARTLAQYVAERLDCCNKKILDLGCGLGLTGIVAALKGGAVTFADKEPDALAFATANAQRNGCLLYEARVLDFTREELDQQFSLILGAEILYDRAAFPSLVTFLIHHLAPGGSAVLADAKRTNTTDFYHALDRNGLCWTHEEVNEREERLPLLVNIVTVYQKSDSYGE